MTRTYSLSFLSVADVGPVEAVQIAAEAGYDAVGLRLLPAAPMTEASYSLLTESLVLKEVQAALRDTGVVVADVEIVRVGEQFDAHSFLPFLERSQQLGARHILVAADDTNEQRLIDSFAKFAELARSYQLTCDLEFMPWTAVKNLETARRVVEASGASNAGVLVDSLHFFRSQSSFEELRALPQHLINYVQLCDAPAIYDPSDEGLIYVARNARLVPNEGQLDLKRLIQCIPASKPVGIEVPNTRLMQTMRPQERAAYMLEKTIELLRE